MGGAYFTNQCEGVVIQLSNVLECLSLVCGSSFLTFISKFHIYSCPSTTRMYPIIPQTCWVVVFSLQLMSSNSVIGVIGSIFILFL